ncbi:MAG: hypothetical protein ACI9YL_002254, partial [Luteibaculaceae bacterium]
ALEVIVAGGGGNYTYSLDGSAQQTSNIFTGLSSSINPFKVLRVYTDDVCGLTDQRVFKDFIIDMGASAPLSLVQYIKDPVTCEDYSDGILEMIINGGDPVFEFTIDGGGTWGTNAISTGLPAGPYNLQAKDGRGCYTPIYSTNLLNPDPLQITEAAVTGVKCFGASTGVLEIVGIGGSEEYKYSIDGGVNFQTTKTFIDLPAGLYDVVFEDLFGCGRIEQQVVIPQNDPVLLNITASSATNCVPGTDGKINLFPRGGVPPYIFEDGNGNFFPEDGISNVGEGIYDFKVTDKWGCKSAWVDVELTSPVPPQADSIRIKDISCYGSGDGVIQGFDEEGLRYSLDSGLTWKPGGLFLNRPAGMYQLRIQDDRGCERIMDDIAVVEPEQVKAVVRMAAEILCFGAEADISVQGLFGEEPYQYSTIGGLSYTTQNEFTLPSGTFTFRVMDNKGCESEKTNFTINAVLELTGNVDLIPTLNGGDGKIIAFGNGGTPPYRYSVDGSTFQTEGFFPNMAEGIHTVEIVDFNGCSWNIEVLLEHISGLAEGENFSGIVVYPNPGRGYFFLKGEKGWKEWTLKNALGQEFKIGTSSVVNLSEFAEGMYLLEVKFQDNTSQVHRLIYQK